MKQGDSYEKLRYPNEVTRSEYCRVTGRIRQNQIAGIISEFLPDYIVGSNYHHADIEVYSRDNLKEPTARFEVKNERKTSYFRLREWMNINSHLGNARITGVIASFGNFKEPEFPDEDKLLFDNLCLLGYQTLPEEYYKHYVNKQNRQFYRIDNIHNYVKLKKRIAEFLTDIGLLKSEPYEPLTIHVCILNNKLDKIKSIIVEFITRLKSRSGFKGKVYADGGRFCLNNGVLSGETLDCRLESTIVDKFLMLIFQFVINLAQLMGIEKSGFC